jgi:DNA-binding XRE family transcriptional regulator
MSRVGMRRPYAHLLGKSHNKKLDAEITSMREGGLEPYVVVLEKCDNIISLVAAETKWIKDLHLEGHKLFNVMHVNKEKKKIHKESRGEWSEFIKTYRKNNGLTQKQFSERISVGIKPIVKLEAGGYNVELSYFLKILDGMGFEIRAVEKQASCSKEFPSVFVYSKNSQNENNR